MGEKFTRNQAERHLMKRELSVYVGTRWYRAPEISLVERRYDQASDMWSFGCVLYELLQYANRDMDQGIVEFNNKERFLFQGSSSFPLSPMKMENAENNNNIDKYND